MLNHPGPLYAHEKLANLRNDELARKALRAALVTEVIHNRETPPVQSGQRKPGRRFAFFPRLLAR